MLTDVQIHAIVSQLKDPAAICGDLIAAANAAGGADNISAVVAACAPRPHTP
jgi:serine/threonine protein phosphatase PrpC